MNKFSPSENVYRDMDLFEKDYWWYVSLRDINKFFLKKFKPSKVLDAGCGTGANLDSIKNLTNSSYGIDIASEALQIAKEKGLKNLYQGNINKLPFENSFFDLIYCLDVFGNLDKDQTISALKEFQRCLKPGGKLIIQTAALNWLNSKHDTYWDIQKRYQLDEFVKLQENLGLKIIKKTYRYFLLFPLIAIVKIKNKYNKNGSSGDLSKLPRLVNFILILTMKLENYLLRFISFPIGSSIFVISQK